MPTFETDDQQNNRRGKRGPLIAPHSGPGFDYRPRRREGGKKNSNSDSFQPAPVPPQVKDEIQKRIDEMMRRSSPPDENLDRVRDVVRLAKNSFRLLRGVIRKKLGLKERADDSDDDEPYDLPPDEETGEQAYPQAQPYSNRRRKKRPAKGNNERSEKGNNKPKQKRHDKQGKNPQNQVKGSSGKPGQKEQSQPKGGNPRSQDSKRGDGEQGEKSRRSRRRGRRGGKKKGANPENQGGAQNNQS